MTATPESWDDVGGLRLQVDCMSQKVEDVEKGLAAFHGLTDSQFQKLKEEVLLIHAQEQREQNKERCQMKICIIIISVLLACALAHLALVEYRHWEEAHKTSLTKKNPISWTAVGKKEPEAKQTPEAEGRSQRVAENDQEFPGNSKGDVEDKENKESEKGEVHEDGEQAKEELGDKSRLSLPIDLGAVLPAGPANAKREHEIKSTLKSLKSIIHEDHMMDSPSLPVQIMSNKSLTQSSQGPQGLFYVCLPSKNFEQSLKKYASVFTEVLHSQKWGLYPFCYVDTRIPKKSGDEDLCDDVKKITFVMEKSRSGVSSYNKDASSPHIPTYAPFENCEDIFWRHRELFKIESPVFFKQTFRAGKVIEASLVEEFINSVYSGQRPEVAFPKRDL